MGHKQRPAAVNHICEGCRGVSLWYAFGCEPFVGDPGQLHDLIRDPFAFRQLYEHVGPVSFYEGSVRCLLDPDRCQLNDPAAFCVEAGRFRVKEHGRLVPLEYVAEAIHGRPPF